MSRSRIVLALLASLLALAGALALASPTEASRSGKQIKILDDCDPASFNAAVGDGTCVGDGRTTFGDFLAELQATQAAADWRFKPSMLKVHAGRPVILENRGGETHTFTLVKQFGGGFVPVLNQLSDNPVPAPECVDPGNAEVPAPPSPVNVFVSADSDEAFATAGLKPGRYMFQCCIHPWMRVILTVRTS
ncbi:MAG: hypothetical protein HOQ22_07115 [Nocardioidaceae bacterium]|nr:hypothetical protein [Nocardioidaceae bacterium]NUS50795.1 hypothetical protein [Nocardioidaceae bacterium]